MAIKLDLEKAFDRMEWNFRKDTLTLPPPWIKLILSPLAFALSFAPASDANATS